MNNPSISMEYALFRKILNLLSLLEPSFWKHQEGKSLSESFLEEVSSLSLTWFGKKDIESDREPPRMQ